MTDELPVLFFVCLGDETIVLSLDWLLSRWVFYIQKESSNILKFLFIEYKAYVLVVYLFTSQSGGNKLYVCILQKWALP